MFNRHRPKAKRGICQQIVTSVVFFFKRFITHYLLPITHRQGPIKYILLALLTFTLTVSWVPAAFGQRPFFPTVESPQSEEPIFDWFNRSYQCGNLRCSNVWFHGTPTLTVASLPPTLTEDGNANISVQQRAKKIEINLKQILKATLNSAETQPRQATGETSDKPEVEPTIVPDPLELIKNRPTASETEEADKSDLHPATPLIEVGILNNQTVIFVPKQPGIPRQTLLTVTESDAIANFQSDPEELAIMWRDRLRSEFSNAIQERQDISNNPLQRPLIISSIAVGVIILTLALLWLQKRLGKKERELKKQLNDFKKSLAAETESVTSENAIKSNKKKESAKTQKSVSEPKIRASRCLLFALTKTEFALATQLARLWETFPELSLKKQTDLKQERNTTVMLRLVLRWLLVSLLVSAMGIIFFIYPDTRAFTVFLWSQSILILLIWLLASLADKGSNFLVDLWLQRWAEQAQQTSSYPQRYTKRVTTYSEALTQATTFIVYLVAIVITIQALGFSLAGAGVIGIAATYVFKPKVDNVINGILILWSDRYAVGDVIQIGDLAGGVENMNLYITELRGDGGRLITIPNGNIDVVQNLTKEWSRAEVAIEIAYDTDLPRALDTLKTLAEKMQNEPEWEDKILEPASIFGLDSVDADGLLVQVWMKTSPIQQWSVGRELRVRIEEAFDREGISLAMPQRSLYLRNSPNGIKTDDNGFPTNSPVQNQRTRDRT